MLSSRDKWIGIVQRMLVGVDMFYLEVSSSTLPLGGVATRLRNIDRVIKFTRIKFWAEDAPHDSIRQAISHILLADPGFGGDFVEKSFVVNTPGVVMPSSYLRLTSAGTVEGTAAGMPSLPLP